MERKKQAEVPKTFFPCSVLRHIPHYLKCKKVTFLTEPIVPVSNTHSRTQCWNISHFKLYDSTFTALQFQCFCPNGCMDTQAAQLATLTSYLHFNKLKKKKKKGDKFLLTCS